MTKTEKAKEGITEKILYSSVLKIHSKQCVYTVNSKGEFVKMTIPPASFYEGQKKILQEINKTYKQKIFSVVSPKIPLCHLDMLAADVYGVIRLNTNKTKAERDRYVKSGHNPLSAIMLWNKKYDVKDRKNKKR